MTDIEYVKPEDIERRSFEIITAELEAMGKSIPADQEMVTKRVIHTSADFSYVDTMMYSEGAVEIAKKLIASGADIVTDTNMGLSGVNKKRLAGFGGQVHCFMADEDIAETAKQEGITRAAASMRKAASMNKNKKIIYAIGNAPTALIELKRLMDEGYKPAFIIGVPVGFVNVEAAKELIIASDVPYIVNRGRKGGSNIAAAICNALIYQTGA